MADRATFLAAIRAAPDDDTPRLVFADWLDERGDPLGEFVRVQVELERIRDELDDPRAQALRRREEELLERHADEWNGGVAGIFAEYPAFGPVFRRGLPEFVCLSLDTFLARGAELFAACPTIREVSLYGVSGRGEELAGCPHLDRVQVLEIADWLTTNDQFLLSRCDAVGRVRVLRLWHETNSHLVYDLHARAGSWPGRVELVPLFPLPEHAPADAPDRKPYPLVYRPRVRTFPIRGDAGQGFIAGRLPDGTPALAAAAGGVLVYATFRDDGSVIQAINETCPRPKWTPQLIRERLQLKPGLVRVQSFKSDRLSVNLWPWQYWTDYLRSPRETPPLMSERAWRGRGGVLRQWLHRGGFVIAWDGREFFADRTGTIFSS
jgi:uncharacterized protein (TIGR02996 family)